MWRPCFPGLLSFFFLINPHVVDVGFVLHAKIQSQANPAPANHNRLPRCVRWDGIRRAQSPRPAYVPNNMGHRNHIRHEIAKQIPDLSQIWRRDVHPKEQNCTLESDIRVNTSTNNAQSRGKTVNKELMACDSAITPPETPGWSETPGPVT